MLDTGWREWVFPSDTNMQLFLYDVHELGIPEYDLGMNDVLRTVKVNSIIDAVEMLAISYGGAEVRE